jgi:hypothetical protein
VTEYRLPFAEQVARLRRQRQWLIDLEHHLDPEQHPPPTASGVLQAVEQFLQELDAWAQTEADPTDQKVVTYIQTSVRSFWWGLFVCYEVDGLPRTNNELERFMRQIKTGQRRISGRQKVHDWIVRYGSYAAYIDYLESEADLLARLQQVADADFQAQRRALSLTLERERTVYRFRHHRAKFLINLEARWAEVVSVS